MRSHQKSEAFPQSATTTQLTPEHSTCIHFCMTKVLTVRLDQELLNKAEARAVQLGLDRAKYVRALIEEDVHRAGPSAERRFASEDLAGLYEGSGRSATNDRVRNRLRERAISTP